MTTQLSLLSVFELYMSFYLMTWHLLNMKHVIEHNLKLLHWMWQGFFDGQTMSNDLHHGDLKGLHSEPKSIDDDS